MKPEFGNSILIEPAIEHLIKKKVISPALVFLFGYLCDYQVVRYKKPRHKTGLNVKFMFLLLCLFFFFGFGFTVGFMLTVEPFDETSGFISMPIASRTSELSCLKRSGFSISTF